jgi:tetratricopeptide (TPR) repeat protein
LDNTSLEDGCESGPNILEPEELLAETLPQQECDIDQDGSSNIPSFDWSWVDVGRSPGGISRLIGAYTLEECRDTPFLNLKGGSADLGQSLSCDPIDLCESGDTDRFRDQSRTDPTLDLVGQLVAKNERCASVSTVSQDSNRVYEESRACSLPRLESGISPFPQQTRTKWGGTVYYGSPILPEFECMKILKSKTPTETPNLMKSMWYIARKCYRTGQYIAAESWYRRIVTIRQHNLWFQPRETIQACLWVIRSITTQGKYLEALQLQEKLHDKVLRQFNPATEVSLLSRGTKSLALTNFGRSSEGQQIRREILQICLTAYGPKHPQTLIALRNLGFVLASMGRHLESEQLLRTALHIQLQEATIYEGDIVNKEEIFKTMTRLARTLNSTGRYCESRILLSSAEELVGEITSKERPDGFYHCCEMAKTWKLEGRLHDSEKMFRDLLKDPGNIQAPGQRREAMMELAEILILSGRPEEGSRWYEEINLLDINFHGITHLLTMQSCQQLGFSYAQLMQYDQAILQFEHAIEKINLSASEDLEICSSCINRVQQWIQQVKRMKTEDFGEVVEHSQIQIAGRSSKESANQYSEA